jgi:hypothetical protein
MKRKLRFYFVLFNTSNFIYLRKLKEALSRMRLVSSRNSMERWREVCNDQEEIEKIQEDIETIWKEYMVCLTLT